MRRVAGEADEVVREEGILIKEDTHFVECPPSLFIALERASLWGAAMLHG
jgi:hypothetical protein